MKLVNLNKRFFLLAFTAICSLATVAIAINFDKLQVSFTQKFGAAALPNFTTWLNMIQSVKGLGTDDKIKRVNEFFNRRIVWGEDQKIWGQVDYWATPLETIGRSTGDCEDFAIAKYYTLINAGVPVSKLRIVYVKAKMEMHQGLQVANRLTWSWLIILALTLSQ